MNLNPYKTKHYNDNSGFSAMEKQSQNKPNQSQFQKAGKNIAEAGSGAAGTIFILLRRRS
jgi:hypothetical protein